MACRIGADWAYKGVKALVLENEYLRITCLPDKGSDIIKILYKPLEIDFLWHFSTGCRKPAGFVWPSGRSDSSFLDFYEGGWQDILPNAGLPSKHRGTDWGQHSESALMPWQYFVEERRPEKVRVHLTTDLHHYPFSVDKWLILEQKQKYFTIKERITNHSEQDLEFSWLQHVAFGEPFLEPGNIISIAAEKAVVHSPEIPHSSLPPGKEFKWPMIRDKKAKQVDLSLIPNRKTRTHDLVYLLDVKEGWYALTNPHLKLTFSLTWDKKVFPHIWYWRPLGGAWDYPWFGKAWAIALEPCTSWPTTGLTDQVKKGTAARLAGGSFIENEMKVAIYTGLHSVTEATGTCIVRGTRHA